MDKDSYIESDICKVIEQFLNELKNSKQLKIDNEILKNENKLIKQKLDEYETKTNELNRELNEKNNLLGSILENTSSISKKIHEANIVSDEGALSNLAAGVPDFDSLLPADDWGAAPPADADGGWGGEGPALPHEDKEVINDPSSEYSDYSDGYRSKKRNKRGKNKKNKGHRW